MNKVFLSLVLVAALTACSRKPYVFSGEEELQNEEPLVLVGDSQPGSLQQETMRHKVIYVPVQEEEQRNPQKQPQQEEEIVLQDNVYKPYVNLTASDLRSKVGSSDIQIKQETNWVDIVLPASFVFGTNQSAIQPSAEKDLSSIANQIKENKRMMVLVRGFTDNSISFLTAKNLSLQRAKAVSDFLQLHGIDYKRIYIAGLGSQDPIASNESAVGRDQNNRVEIRLIGIQ